MLFTISRTSDEFRSDPAPSREWPPHREANWHADRNNWFIELHTAEQVASLSSDDTTKVILHRRRDFMHIEIDDVSVH